MHDPKENLAKEAKLNVGFYSPKSEYQFSSVLNLYRSD